MDWVFLLIVLAFLVLLYFVITWLAVGKILLIILGILGLVGLVFAGFYRILSQGFGG